MTDFKKQLLSKRCISVWGMGYLGYTILLRLQSKGFLSNIYDFDTGRLDGLIKGVYPAKEHMETWSEKGEVPAINLSKISVPNDMAAMFQNSVHIISFPGKGENHQRNSLMDLSDCFLDHREKAHGSLVLFQSAETPDDIQKHFIEPLKKNNVACSIATIFRTDWSMEEFLFSMRKQVLSGIDTESVAKAKLLLYMLDMEYHLLSSIKEAEIYECARKSLYHMVATFINQLAFAYSDTDIRRMVGLLLKEIQLDDIHPGVGPIDYKSASAVAHLLEGSRNPERLTIVREAEHANLSAILNYAEIIKRHGVKKVCILGISEKGDRKDVRLSPSLILAEHLLKRGVSLSLHDPYYSSEEINRLLSGADYMDVELLSSDIDCIVMMTAHRFYRYMTQEDIDYIGISSVRIIIDNAGLWKDFKFSPDSLYHIPGDGNLRRLE